MNRMCKLLQIEINWFFFPCHSNFHVFPFLKPTNIQVKKEQRPEELWTKVTLFLYCHHSKRLSGLELLVISWQRTPSPGLTVKGGRNLLNVFHSLEVCARVGEGVPQVAGSAMKSCCHLLAQGQNLHFSRKPASACKSTFFGGNHNCFCFPTSQALKTCLLNSFLAFLSLFLSFHFCRNHSRGPTLGKN